MDTASGIVAVVLGGGALVGIITPILKLNSSIVNLTSKIEELTKNMNRNEQRITKHGAEIEQLERQVDRHELRIYTLEEHQKKCGQG